MRHNNIVITDHKNNTKRIINLNNVNTIVISDTVKFEYTNGNIDIYEATEEMKSIILEYIDS